MLWFKRCLEKYIVMESLLLGKKDCIFLADCMVV